MQNVLAIDVAKGKSMVTLISSSGEVLIDPYEINPSINDFTNLLNRFNNIKELTAYCGLGPSIKQSGKSVDIHGPISKAGNKYMRKILYIACSNIIRLTAISKQENDIEIYYRKKT